MIAISYRRDDSLPVAGRLYDRLQNEFGKGNVFMDFDSIPYGVDFRDHIKKIIESSKLVVAMIGPDWVGKRRHRTRRIDDPADFVRLEIVYALERGLPLIPVLINNTPMPQVRDLPVGLESLAFRNALTLDAGIDFHHHADRLIAGINRLLNVSPPPALATPKDQVPQIFEERAQALPAPIETHLAPPETTTPPVAKTPPPPVPREFPPVKPSEPLAEITPAEISTSSIHRPKATLKAPEESAPLIAPRKSPVVEWSEPKSCKPAPQSSKKTKISAPLLAAERAGWFVRLRKSIAHLQDKMMADYIRLPQARRERESVPHSRRQRRIALSGTVVLLAAVAITTTWYWGFRAPGELPQSNKKGPIGKPPSGLLVDNKAKSPEIAKGEAAPAAAAVNAAPTESPTSKSAQIKGTLTIDSTPEGVAYEIIAGDSNHRTGTTPATLEDLPKGYAQVFYKGTDSEHREMVWIESGKTSSTRWTVPDKAPSPVAQVPAAPPAPSVAPSITPDVTSVDRMNEFVRQFLETNDSSDVDRAVSFYAPNAEIFEEGRKSLDSIRRDIQSYNGHWPIRRDNIRGAIQMREEIPNQEYNASFQQDYYVEDPARRDWIRGTVSVDLRISVVDGLPKISSIKQRTLNREKGRGKGPGLIVKNDALPANSALAAPSPPLPGSNPPIIEGPQKLIRVVNKQYSFFALVPAEVFPDAMHASDTNQTSFSTTKGRTKLDFLVRDNSDGETFKKLYQEWIAEHTAAQPNKKVHYKPLRDKWFVVSGIDGPRGFYVEAVKKGNIVVVMSLEYDETASPLTPQTLSKMSQTFKEN